MLSQCDVSECEFVNTGNCDVNEVAEYLLFIILIGRTRGESCEVWSGSVLVTVDS